MNTAGTQNEPKTRLFTLVRNEDETGVSGTGIVAEGVQFASGKCVLTWLTEFSSVAVYDGIGDLLAIHGHHGRTVVEFQDGGSEAPDGDPD